jgi:hypothetical protein
MQGVSIMSFRHAFDLVIFDNKVRFDFKNPDHYTSNPHRRGLVALDAVLTTALHLKEKEDYTVKDGEYEGVVSITIESLVNSVYVLEFLLTNEEAKAKFSYSPRYYDPNDEIRTQSSRWRLIVACLDKYDKLSMNDLKILFPIMRGLLDYQYDMIKDEELVKKLELKPNEKYGDDLFAHPFYQILRMLKEDFNAKLKKYNTKHSLFESKPTDEKHQKTYARFMSYIPVCFCDIQAYSGTKTLSAEKLKRAVVKEESTKVTEIKATSRPPSFSSAQ